MDDFGSKDMFTVQIRSTLHNTWQGNIRHSVDDETHFRSTLEMIMAIDSLLPEPPSND